jgi:hypothetical protein
MTRKTAIRILQAHGWEPTSPTAAWPKEANHPMAGQWDPNSSFDATFGIRSRYSYRAVMEWLGY